EGWWACERGRRQAPPRRVYPRACSDATRRGCLAWLEFDDPEREELERRAAEIERAAGSWSATALNLRIDGREAITPRSRTRWRPLNHRGGHACSARSAIARSFASSLNFSRK